MDNRTTRKEQLECKDKVISLVRWTFSGSNYLPYYMRLALIHDFLTLAGLIDHNIYIMLEWILRLQMCTPRLFDDVYELVEKKKNYDIKNIFIAHDFWFTRNPGLALPNVWVPYQLRFNFEDVELHNLDMSGIENFETINSIDEL